MSTDSLPADRSREHDFGPNDTGSIVCRRCGRGCDHDIKDETDELGCRTLDPGRWEYDEVLSWRIDGPGSRGVTLHPNGEIWNNIDGPPELTAEDYEAAARIVRSYA